MILVNCHATAVMSGPNNTLWQLEGVDSVGGCPTKGTGITNTLGTYTDRFVKNCPMGYSDQPWNVSFVEIAAPWGNQPPVFVPPDQPSMPSLLGCMQNQVKAADSNTALAYGLGFGLGVPLGTALIVCGIIWYYK